jgi:excisionase family DNA binding protein
MQTELPKLLSVPEVAAILGRHPRTVMNLVRAGQLSAVKIGHRGVRFTVEDVNDYIDAHRVPVTT